MATIESRKTSRAELIAALRAAGAVIRKESSNGGIKCPFHDDRNPSGGIYQDSSGHWRYKCHAGSCGFCGDVFDIEAKVKGISVDDLLKQYAESNRHDTTPVKKRGRPPKIWTRAEIESMTQYHGDDVMHEKTYVYNDPDTMTPDLVIFRFVKSNGKKVFLQATPINGTIDRLTLGLPKDGRKLPIYNRKRVKAADMILIVEGEKCVHALHEAGIVATTSPGGSNKAHYADWSPLAGKAVFLWPDNDDAGQKYIHEVLIELKQLKPAPKIFWINIEPLGLHEGGDAYDYLQQFGTRYLKNKAIQSLMADATPEQTFEQEFEDHLNEMRSGKWRAIPWPWPILTGAANALIPGTVTLICGDPGSGKSLFLLESAIYWKQSGFSVKIYELEEDKKYHTKRVMAILAGKADITLPSWHEAQPERSQEIFSEYGSETLEFAEEVLYDSPKRLLKRSEILEWVKQQIEAGVELICVDPITALEQTGKVWAEDIKLVIALKIAIYGTNSRLVIVTHPKVAGQVKPGLEKLAGGSAWARFPQCIIWIKRHDQPVVSPIKNDWGTDMLKHNRTLSIMKARNGPGAGLELAYNFDGPGYTFAEIGEIDKIQKKEGGKS